jgi:hypothetical protein
MKRRGASLGKQKVEEKDEKTTESPDEPCRTRGISNSTRLDDVMKKAKENKFKRGRIGLRSLWMGQRKKSWAG